MTNVRPFRGLRPRKNLAAKLASLPYDVIDTQGAREKAEGNPYSFFHVTKPEIDLHDSVDPYAPQVYEKGRENFRKFISERILVQDSKPCYYIYRQIWGDHSQTGLVACASVDEYLHGQIKKHEHTRPDKVADRLRLMTTLEAQTGPIFLTFRDKPELLTLLEQGTSGEPTYDFVADYGVRHIFYVIDEDAQISRIQANFAKLDNLYIADGHHRAEGAAQTCLKLRQDNPHYTGDEEFNFFLSVIFPASHMLILPYNRVVKDLNQHRVAELLVEIGKKFTVEKISGDLNGPQHPKEFGMYLDGSWYLLQIKPEWVPSHDAVKSLDVALLQEHVLDPLLGIADPRTDKRISFVGGIKGNEELVQLVKSGQYAIAFSLYPTLIDQVIRVADAGGVMPPKSTWFEPKLLSGLVTHLLHD